MQEDRLALAVTTCVNGPAFKKRLSERHVHFAVAFAMDLEGSLATAAGSVRCEARVEGRCSRDPDAVHHRKTRPVNEGKALLGRARLCLRSRLHIGADNGFDPNSAVTQPVPEGLRNVAAK
jgi:hypothetical protein